MLIIDVYAKNAKLFNSYLNLALALDLALGLGLGLRLGPRTRVMVRQALAKH